MRALQGSAESLSSHMAPVHSFGHIGPSLATQWACAGKGLWEMESLTGVENRAVCPAPCLTSSCCLGNAARLARGGVPNKGYSPGVLECLVHRSVPEALWDQVGPEEGTGHR